MAKKDNISLEVDLVWVVIIAAIAFATIILGVLFSAKLDLDFHCKLEDIEYVKLEGAKCYGDFSSNYCPMPKTIECSGGLNVPMTVVNGMLKK